MPFADKVRLILVAATVCSCAAGVGEVDPGSTSSTSGGGSKDQNATPPVEQGGSSASIGGSAGTAATTPHPGDAATGSFEPPSSEPPLAPLTFTASTDDFLNPERGFHADLPLPAETIDDARGRGLSLMRSYVVLDRASDTISPTLLSNLAASLRAVRDRGLKVVLRFSYGLSAGPDAPQGRILAHIAQLKPTLQANADILLVLQAGFIGQWGEWHDSTNGLDNDASRKAILSSLLDAVPTSRMVEVRYPWQLRSIFPDALSDATAFLGSSSARIGIHDDCFVADDTDSGTYWDFGGNKAQEVAVNRSFTAQQTRYVATGGETCKNESQSACAIATQQLAQYHFSYLNDDFHPGVNDRWRAEGCMPEIKKRLGYRFELVRAALSSEVAPGGLLYLQATVKNVGYAAPFNARPIYVVLEGGGQKRAALLPAVDWRRWSPEAGETTVNAKLRIPVGTTPGSYRVALWLPDGSTSLQSRAEYAVRFASNGVWNANGADNTLSSSLQVSANAKGSRDPTSQTFAALP